VGEYGWYFFGNTDEIKNSYYLLLFLLAYVKFFLVVFFSLLKCHHTVVIKSCLTNTPRGIPTRQSYETERFEKTDTKWD
jgi:hypothetical protein